MYIHIIYHGKLYPDAVAILFPIPINVQFVYKHPGITTVPELSIDILILPKPSEIKMLQLEVDIDDPVLPPSNTLYDPIVIPDPAPLPIAVLLVPLESNPNELHPIAIF